MLSECQKKKKVELLKSAGIVVLVILLIISFCLYRQKSQPNLEVEIKRLKEQSEVKENGEGGNINSEEIRRLEMENGELQKEIQNLKSELQKKNNAIFGLYNFARRGHYN